MVMLRTTLVAAAVVESPAWLAVIRHVPSANAFNVVPLMEQAVDVVVKEIG